MTEFFLLQLLKGRHMMVRVGGGWDTLEHFLQRHDPCQVKVVSRDGRDAVLGALSSPAPVTGLDLAGLAGLACLDAPGGHKFLHIRAKYRSPTPDTPNR